jgi:hypothetical protein
MGSFGISMGGIASIITAAVEPRLRVHVVALAGGSLPDILLSSKDNLLTKPRAKYLAKQHLDLATLGELLRRHVRTDPLLMAPYVDANRLLLFIALSDRTIGRANSFRLRQALGRPPTVYFPLGHYTSYLMLPYLKAKSLRYFKTTLGVPAPSSSSPAEGDSHISKREK